MSKKFTVSAVIPASPQAIYDAWLDSRTHGKMTGGGKAKASPKVGAKHASFDGYAMGVNLELVPGERIVQSWRTTDFADADPDSRVTLTLAKTADGAKLTLVHTDIPGGQDDYKTGWQEYYFAPMQAYFAALAPPKKSGRAKKKPAKARKTARTPR